MSVTRKVWSVAAILATGVLAFGALLSVSGCKKSAGNQYVAPPPPEVTVAQPLKTRVRRTYEFTGTTRGRERVEIRARVKGFIQQKHIEGGKRVKAGDLIFTIDPRNYQASVAQAEADVASAQADLDLALVTQQRVEDAFRSNASNQQEVDTAKARTAGAQARLDLAKAGLVQARLDLEYTQVRSPINGRLSLETIDVGQLVGANDATLLAYVIDDSQIFARYSMPEKLVLQLREQYANRRPGEDGRPNLRVRMALPNESDFVHEGWFDKGDNSVNPETGTISVEAVYDNAEGTILPGLFVRVQPVFGERDTLLIPDVAVQADQAGRFVYVVGADNKVERRGVTLGANYGRLASIETGLTGSELVIVNGVQRARPGSPVNPTQTKVEPPDLGALGNPPPPPPPSDRPATSTAQPPSSTGAPGAPSPGTGESATPAGDEGGPR